jgi:hypothetical protein
MGGQDDDEKMRKTRVIIIPRSVGRSVDGWLGPSPAVRIRTPFLFLSSPSPCIHPPHSLPLPNPNNNNNNNNNNNINTHTQTDIQKRLVLEEEKDSEIERYKERKTERERFI